MYRDPNALPTAKEFMAVLDQLRGLESKVRQVNDRCARLEIEMKKQERNLKQKIRNVESKIPRR